MFTLQKMSGVWVLGIVLHLTAFAAPEIPEFKVSVETADKAGKHFFVVETEAEVSAVAFAVTEYGMARGWQTLKAVQETAPENKTFEETSSEGTAAEEAPAEEKAPDKFSYRSEGSSFAPNQTLTVSFWLDSDHQVVTAVVVPTDFRADSKAQTWKTTGTKIRTRAEYEEKRKNKEVSNAWLAAVNRHRASRGLARFRHSPHLYWVSYQNDEMGGVHAYTEGRQQIWSGTNDIQGAINMWFYSYYGSHGYQLDAGHTEAGVYCGKHGCTITF